MPNKVLQFVNVDAKPMVTTLVVPKEAVPVIMKWYGFYYAGDNYNVMYDGKIVRKDQNGVMTGEN